MANIFDTSNMSALGEAAYNKNQILNEGAKQVGALGADRTLSMLKDNNSIELIAQENGAIKYQVTPDFYNNMENWSADTTDRLFGENLKRYMSKDGQGNVIYKRNEKIGNPVEAKPTNGVYPVPDVLLAKLEANPKDPTLLGLKEEYETGQKKVLAIPTLTKERKIKFLTRNRTDDPSDTVSYIDKDSFAAFAQSRLNQLFQQSDPEGFSENSSMEFIGNQLANATNRSSAINAQADIIAKIADDKRISPGSASQGVAVAADKEAETLSDEVKAGFDDPNRSTPLVTTPPPAAEEEEEVDETTLNEDTSPAIPDNRPSQWMNSESRRIDTARFIELGDLISNAEAELEGIKESRTVIKATSNNVLTQEAKITYEKPEDEARFNELENEIPNLRKERIQINARVNKLDQLAKDDPRTDNMGQPLPLTKENVNDIDQNDPNAGVLISRKITTSSQVTEGINNGTIANIQLEDNEVTTIQEELKNLGVKNTEDAKKKVETGEIKNPVIVAMGMVNALAGADGKIYGMDRKDAFNFFYNGMTQGLPSAKDPAEIEVQTDNIVAKARASGQVDRGYDQADITLSQNKRSQDQKDIELAIAKDRVDVDRAQLKYKNADKARATIAETYKFFAEQKKEADEKNDGEYAKISESYDGALLFAMGTKDANGKLEGKKSDNDNFKLGYKAKRDSLQRQAKQGGVYARAASMYNDAMSDIINADPSASLFRFDADVFMQMSDGTSTPHNLLMEQRTELAYVTGFTALQNAQGGGFRRLFSKDFWGDFPNPNDPNFNVTKFFRERLAIRTGADGKPAEVVIFKLGPNGTLIEAESSVAYGYLKNLISGEDLKIILNNASVIGDSVGSQNADWLSQQPTLAKHLQSID